MIVRPRARPTGWEAVTANRFRISWSKGPVTRVWAVESDKGNWAKVSALPTSDREWWHDETNGYLYVYLVAPGSNGDGPEDPTDVPYMAEYGETVAGLTVEYELYLSTTNLRGPRDPLDTTSDPVDWLGVLEQSPRAAGGSRQQLFGFQPSEESPLAINDQDGWFLPHLYDSSFALAEVRALIMVGTTDLERAAELGYVFENFIGYCGQPARDADGLVTLPCYDFLAFLDRRANPPQRMSLTEFSLAEPASVVPGREWFIRRVRGMVDGFEPINIDYNATPATNVNRDFLTHEDDGTEGTWGATVDHTGTNDATHTTLLTTPQCNVGDSIIIQRSGVDKYVYVSAVDRVTKVITHSNISGSASASDQVIRYYIGNVHVQDSDGRWWALFAGRSYSRIDKATLSNNPDWKGFRLIDNWEADIGFPETFDPVKHKVVVRVYGTESLAKYADGTTDVGALVNDGGNAAQSVSILHWLLREAGVPNALIDQTSFAAASTNHALGLAIPRTRSESVAQSWKEYIRLVLVSMMWKLHYVQRSSELKIGLLETGPMGSADYEADDFDFRGFEFQHDYSAVYDRVELSYGFKELPMENGFDPFYLANGVAVADGTQVASAENQLARDLHLIAETFEEGILQYLLADAQTMAARYAFALGDRRAFYSFLLGPAWLEKVELGTSYNLKRKGMPGFALDPDTYRERQTTVVEVTHGAQGAILTVEDQKGVEDNAGDW